MTEKPAGLDKIPGLSACQFYKKHISLTNLNFGLMYYKKLATRLVAFLLPILGLSLASCSSEDEPDDETTTEVKVVSCSVSNNETISPSTSSITITYSSSIVANTSAGNVTLNNTSCSTTVSGATLTVKVALKNATNYTLTVPARYIVGVGTSSFAPAYTVSFNTSGEAVVANFASITNPSATKEAKNVYNFLVEQNGKKIISGAMANVNNNNDFANWMYNKSGKYPALTCYDFIHLPYSGQNWIDYSDITPATTQWQNNGLVAYMWHWLVPASEADYQAKNYSNYSYNASFDIEAALTDGTWQHECINNDIATVAGWLKQLQDAGIPVLWRPLHEAAGDYSWGPWFWWGKKGVETTKRLWIYLHDKLVNEYKLNNLIWVWTVQTSDAGQLASADKMKAAYPGDDYVDIIGTDIYAETTDSQIEIYDALIALTNGKKMVTLSETGLLQDPGKCISDGANWSYFMLWYTNDIHKSTKTTDDFGNTVAHITDVMNSSSAITREQMPSLK
jgi:mannan endo-1,4-beta-mannosidase